MSRRKRSVMKTAMYFCLITAMNLAGVCYGQWQHGLTSVTEISTGNIKPCFSGKADIKKAAEFNKLRASLKMDDYSDRKYISVSGEIESEKDGNFTIDYRVCNNGSAPITFDSDAFDDMNKGLLENGENGIRLVGSPKSTGIIYPIKAGHSGKTRKGSLTLQIDTSQGVGEYEFEIQIPYRQWTGD